MYSISFEFSTASVHHLWVFLDSKYSGHIFLLVVLLSLSEVISYLKIIFALAMFQWRSEWNCL